MCCFLHSSPHSEVIHGHRSCLLHADMLCPSSKSNPICLQYCFSRIWCMALLYPSREGQLLSELLNKNSWNIYYSDLDQKDFFGEGQPVGQYVIPVVCHKLHTQHYPVTVPRPLICEAEPELFFTELRRPKKSLERQVNASG